MSLADLLNLISVKDAVTFLSLGVLAYNARMAYNTLQASAHQHSDHEDGHSLRSDLSMADDADDDWEFGFQAEADK